MKITPFRAFVISGGLMLATMLLGFAVAYAHGPEHHCHLVNGKMVCH